MPDPRHPYGWRLDADPLPLVGLLQLTVAALLCGARSLYAVAQWGRERLADEPELLMALGLPPGRSPCVATLHRVFKALDVAACERAIGSWLSQTGVAPDDPVAIDGKTLRGVHGTGLPGEHLVAAYSHRAGAVLAQLRTPGKGCELAGAAGVLAEAVVQGRVVTADALLTQRQLSAQIVTSGGHYLLPVDDNQPALRTDVAAAFSPVGAGTGADRRQLDTSSPSASRPGRTRRRPAVD